MSYYGTNTDGNSLPIFEYDLLDYLNQKFDWFSYCLEGSTDEAAPSVAAACVEGVEDCNDTPEPLIAE